MRLFQEAYWNISEWDDQWTWSLLIEQNGHSYHCAWVGDSHQRGYDYLRRGGGRWWRRKWRVNKWLGWGYNKVGIDWKNGPRMRYCYDYQ